MPEPKWKTFRKCAVCGCWCLLEELLYSGIEDDETGGHDVFECVDCYDPEASLED